jgi:hypothetical protein
MINSLDELNLKGSRGFKITIKKSGILYSLFHCKSDNQPLNADYP